jgi:hypothetical protein
MLPRSTKIATVIAVIAVALALVVPATQSAGPQFFSTTTTRSGFGFAGCAAGSKMTGGGVATLPQDRFSSRSSTEYALTGSFPSGSGWDATATVTRGDYSDSVGWSFRTSSYTPRVFVVCAR